MDRRAAPSGARIERFFSGVGLAAGALSLLVVVLGVDVLLTRSASRLDGNPISLFSLSTIDGRLLGWDEEGLRTRLTPGTVYEFEPNQAVGPYRINSLGLRGDEVARDPARERFVVVGGSAAFGLDVAEQSTFAARLARTRRDTEVLNAGVIGYLSGQELSLLMRKLLDLHPDLVIAFNGWNDLYDPYWWWTLSGREPVFGVNTIFRQIEDRLHAYRRIRHEPSYALLEAFRSISRQSTLLTLLHRRLGRWSAPEAVDFDAAWMDRAVATYVRNARRMNDLSRARGSRLLVVLQPELGQMLDVATRLDLAKGDADFEPHDRYWVRFPELFTEFRRRVVEELGAAGVEVLDASRVLEPQGLAASALFLDPVHLSDAGHRNVQAMLGRYLAASGRGHATGGL